MIFIKKPKRLSTYKRHRIHLNKLNLKQKNLFLKKRKYKVPKINYTHKLLINKEKKKLTFTNIKVLKTFISPSLKIFARRKTKLSIKMQKKIAKLIKHARNLRLIPYVGKQIIKSLFKKYKTYKK